MDGGANRSVTNDATILTGYRNIKKYAMNGVSAEGPAIQCTGLGLLPWKADAGETIFIKCYYSTNAAETIISPTDVVHNHMADLNAWSQHCNLDKGKGHIEFHFRNHEPSIKYTLHAHNNLWYHDGTACTINDYNLNLEDSRPIVRRLTQPAQYELFHQRFGHPGERTMSILHKHVDHVPQLKGNSFYKCASCLHAKSKQRAHNNTSLQDTMTPSTHNSNSTISDNNEPPIQCGQHFNIDFGFMKGSGYCTKDQEGYTITSIDGYRSYCLIIDRLSCYTWIFLTKTKTPPIDMIKQFLQQHGNTHATRKTIQTDEGGELWHSQHFRQMAMEANYILGYTAHILQTDYHIQPHRKHHINIRRPSARNLRVFGCPIIAKLPGKRNTKLDIHTCSGRFLGYTATDKNIYCRDEHTHRIKNHTLHV